MPTVSAPTIDSVIEKAKSYLPQPNEDRLRRAFQFAYDAHRGQTRFSGEPYIIHPLHVADIILDFHPDEDTLVTALLHDVAEDTDRTLDDIEREFGNNIRVLCDGLVKLSKVRSRLNDPQMENLRKLFLAMAKDFRVVLLKLCDRLHNMRTMEFVRPEKRTRIAQETLNIYAPIAARLGIYRLKSQLEDLCFQMLQPDDFKNISDQLIKTEKWRQRYIEMAKKILMETLAQEGIQTAVDGRVKSVYSIYRKMKKKNKFSLEEIFDVFAMRIVLPDIYKYGKEYTGHLYTALGIIHNHFTPLANRFKDYVAVPKVNGYRSLHTTVMGLGPKIHTQPTEVQIRTDGMHQSAEFGIAAHWLYEEDKSGNPPATLEAAQAATLAPFFKQQKDWIADLQKIEEEIASNQELLENLKVDVFQDRIFVLTPRGDVKDLPISATPVDFAYAVHTEIGNHCVGAKVNGSIVPLDYELKSGEVVEIVTRKNAKPSHQWLSFVKTNHARNRIRAWFRNLDDEKHLKTGRELLNEKLEQLGRPVLDDHLSILRTYDGRRLALREREELLKEIGRGGVLAGTVIRKIFSLEELLQSRPSRDLRRGEAADRGSELTPRPSGKEQSPKLLIGEQTNTPYQFVQCCSAKYSDDLVGYVTRGKGISVHRKDCPVIANMDRQRFIKVRAALTGQGAVHPVHVKIEADDRLGLVRDISHIIAENQVNILDFSQSPRENSFAELNFVIEINDFDQLERVLLKLSKIPSVRRACKVN